ncbi:clustered mitochondria protein homolog [Lampetra fluviatilis]
MIAVEAMGYYNFRVDCEGVDEAVEKFSLQKVSMLREVCIKMGIQLRLRDYPMDGDQRAAFTAEDVLELRPLVRHAQTAASDAPAFMYSGQSRVEQGEVREGCELVAEALHLYIAVYGATHRDTADCLRVLARLHYSLGRHSR